MRKLVLSSVLSAVLFTTGTAQTLVTIGGQGVSKEDFLKAYYKNNTTEKATEKSYKDYLDLYTRYKLKVRAAYDMRLDTLPGQVVELQNFRAQVAETFMNDAESLDKLVSEAFNRGQKDIHLAHIFIAIPKDASPGDTAKAYEKAMAAYNALKRGKSFSETALAFSEDPSVKDNSGQIGYITVFTLPYELENLAYSTAPGKFSKPFRSRAGYHIFKNLAERKSLGKMKGAQILLPLPPGSTMAVRTDTQLRADSIYKSLLQGADFAQQAKLFSGDNLSYMTGGEMPEFGVGKYDPAFEAAAFGLDKDGEIGRPVLSSYGYHIIKRLARKPFPRQLTKETTAELKQEVMGDPRIEASKNAFLQRIYQQAGLRRSEFQETELWAYTDSALLNKSLSAFPGIDNRTTLFSFTKQQYNVKEWLDYVKSVPNLRARNGNKTDRALFEKYVQAAALEYYRNHLEDYNKDFAFQLTEFKEGNLLFEIMQRKIWDKASTDSSSLKKYYENHRDRYWWEPSADAILFTCSNEKAAEDLKKGLQLNPADWRKTVDAAGATVQADSGRYELAQLQAPGKVSFTPGQFTPFSRSSGTDNAVSFSYIQHIYQERSPRNYLDARGFVINDYQNFLEEQWMTELRKKYIVKVDDSVFGGLSK